MLYLKILLCLLTFSASASQMSQSEAMQIDQSSTNQQTATPAALIQAIRNNNEKAVAELLAAGVSPSSTVRTSNNQTITPLRYAFGIDNANIFRMLVQADRNYAGMLLNDLVSSGRGNRAIAEILIKAGANVNDVRVGPGRQSTLAFAFNDRELAAMLLNAGANPNDDRYEETALNAVIYRDNFEMVKILLKAGANPNQGDDVQGLPLLVAMKRHDLEMVELLLSSGANPNGQVENGETFLTWAGQTGDGEMVQLLLKYNADPNAKDGASRTIYDIAETHPAIKKVLHDFVKQHQLQRMGTTRSTMSQVQQHIGSTQPSKAELQINNDLNQALFDALAEEGINEDRGIATALNLLRGNAEHEIPNIYEKFDRGNGLPETALIHAARNDHPSIRVIQRLIDLGSPVNAQNEQGKTALMAAVTWKYNPRIVHLLLKSGADLNLQDKEGNTALIWAARANDPYALELLLQAGANPNKKNNEDKTFLNYVKEQKTDFRMADVVKKFEQRQKAYGGVSQKALEGLLKTQGGQAEQLAMEVQQYITPQLKKEKRKRSESTEKEVAENSETESSKRQRIG